jgi:serine O-acetyltransferase
LAWLLLTLGVLLLARSRVRSDFKEDVRRRYEMRRAIRPGQNVRLSFAFVARLMGDQTIWATMLYRICRVLVRHRLGPLAEAVHSFARLVTHTDLNPRAQIGPGLYLYHGLGTVIGKGSHLGRNALVCQGVTTGGGHVRIGDDVSIWAGAKVIGNVTVGDRSDIGANAVVIADVPPDTAAVGVPATRYIPKTAPEAV